MHVPTYLVRRSTGARFQDDHYDITGEQLGMDVELNARGTRQEQMSQIARAYDLWLASGAAEVSIVPPSDFGPDVELHVDTGRRPTFDIQNAQVRDGRLTADALLDRVVFGSPVMAEDMWKLHRLHEISRRRSGECGLDVIVASAQRRQGQYNKRQPMMTAEAAAQALVKLACELDPGGALATSAVFEGVPQTAEVFPAKGPKPTKKLEVETHIDLFPAQGREGGREREGEGRGRGRKPLPQGWREGASTIEDKEKEHEEEDEERGEKEEKEEDMDGEGGRGGR